MRIKNLTSGDKGYTCNGPHNSLVLPESSKTLHMEESLCIIPFLHQTSPGFGWILVIRVEMACR